MKILYSKKYIMYLLKLIFQHKLSIFIAILCMTIMAATTAIMALMIKPLLDSVFLKKSFIMLNLTTGILIIIYTIKGASMYGHEYYMEYIGQSLAKRLRDKLYSNIINSPIEIFEKKKIGNLMSRITYDVNVIKNMISATITTLIRDTLTIIFLTLVIFYRNWKMAIFASLLIPSTLILIINFGKKTRQLSNNIQNAMADLNIFLHETFIGNKIIKAYNMEFNEKNKFKKKTQHIFLVEIKNAIVKALSSPIMELLAGIVIALVIWYEGCQNIKNNSETNSTFSFIFAIIMLYEPIKKITKTNSIIQEGLTANNRVFNLIELKSEIIIPNLTKNIKKKSYFIKFNNVSLKHDNKYILKNINFKTNPGEITAIVGISGGGKTSILNIIAKFYNPSLGDVFINNVNIKNISLLSLRKQISIVTQEPILFNDTIRNNITYGSSQTNNYEIEKAIRSSYAYNFIKHFPNKLNTLAGEFGNKLSGGEKQRICIARALLKNTPIIILDEATSSLDTKSEIIVQKALKNLLIGRNTFIVAHRLSTIINANKILVISNGKIVEIGTHNSLIKKQSYYYKLFKSQFNNQNKI